jgi:hypothetical protein
MWSISTFLVLKLTHRFSQLLARKGRDILRDTSEHWEVEFSNRKVLNSWESQDFDILSNLWYFSFKCCNWHAKWLNFFRPGNHTQNLTAPGQNKSRCFECYILQNRPLQLTARILRSLGILHFLGFATFHVSVSDMFKFFFPSMRSHSLTRISQDILGTNFEHLEVEYHNLKEVSESWDPHEFGTFSDLQNFKEYAKCHFFPVYQPRCWVYMCFTIQTLNPRGHMQLPRLDYHRRPCKNRHCSVTFWWKSGLKHYTFSESA